MIKSVKHKGLKRLLENDDVSKLPARQVSKIRDILTHLEFAQSLDDINLPGLRLHPLQGELKGFWSIRVSGNYRIIFRYEEGHVFDVDYLDYH